MATTTDTEQKVETSTGDHDKFSHYADAAEVTRGYVEGTPVTALCGKTWVPADNPEKYPVCPGCRDIYNALFLTGA